MHKGKDRKGHPLSGHKRVTPPKCVKLLPGESPEGKLTKLGGTVHTGVHSGEKFSPFSRCLWFIQ